MDFRDLECFLTTARERNISRAAEKLFVSQPSLSQTIANLEKRAGYPLFQRLQHGLSLTDEGKIFFETAGKIIQIWDEFNDEVGTITEGKSSRIRLGISYFYSGFLLPGGLLEIRKQYPNVEIRVNTETSSVLERMLVNGNLDVAVLVADKIEKTLVSEVLFFEELLLAVSPESPLVKHGSMAEGETWPFMPPECLDGQSFILSPPAMRLRQSAEDFFRSQRLQYKTAVVTASIETANRLAAYNGGIAFIPATYAESIETAPKPVYFKTASSLKDWTLRIAWRGGLSKNKLIRRFVQVFKESI